jgi:hypothetical protein
VSSIAEKTRGLEKRDGFLPVYWDANTGKLWLEVPAARLNQELLFITGAPTGLGSNDIGLDRGQIGGERIVTFQRVGNKVLLVQPNYGFRSSDTSTAVRRAVEELSPISTLWGFKVKRNPAGRFGRCHRLRLRDVHNVIGALPTAPGTYRTGRLAHTSTRAHQVFPRNTGDQRIDLTYPARTPAWVRCGADPESAHPA